MNHLSAVSAFVKLGRGTLSLKNNVEWSLVKHRDCCVSLFPIQYPGFDCMEIETTESEKHNCAAVSYGNEITIEDIDEVIQRNFSDPSSSVNEQTIERELSSEFATQIEMASATHHRSKPAIKILIQPASKALRFRYECEGRSAGSLPGANSTTDNKTLPTIQIVNCKGPAVVVVSCVTKDSPYRPHPHKLVGKDGCRKGVCTVQVSSENMVCTFSNLGIQCVKRRDVEEALREREELRVDPFRTGFEHRTQTSNIDLNSVRLCFQAFIEGTEKGKFTVPLQPVVSDPIFDKKAMSDLVITKLSACAGTVRGGTEIILLCEKVTKDDIEIRFYKENNNEVVEWEALADFGPNDVHKQVAIVFRTPPYKDLNIQHPVEVRMQLRRRSDSSTSEPRTFQYKPLDLDPEWLERKHRKVASDSLKRYLDHNLGLSNLLRMDKPSYAETAHPSTTYDLPSQPRSFKFANRRNIKQEPAETMRNPLYSPFEPCNTLGIPSTSSYQMPSQMDIVSTSSYQLPSQSTVLRPMYVSPSNPSPMLITSTPPPPPVQIPEVLKPTFTFNEMMSMQTGEEPNLLLLESVPPQHLSYSASEDRNKLPGAQNDEVQNTSLDLNFSLDSAELNNLLPISDSSMQEIMKNSSLPFSSLESTGPPDSLTNLQNEIMELNQLADNSQSSSHMQ